MLYLIGLGLSDEKDVTVRGLEAIKGSDRIYLEAYTSILGVGKDRLVRVASLSHTLPLAHADPLSPHRKPFMARTSSWQTGTWSRRNRTTFSQTPTRSTSPSLSSAIPLGELVYRLRPSTR
jgi:hypothetical protein